VNAINYEEEDFVKISDGRIMQVKPKGANGEGFMEPVDGKMRKKKRYWMNATYIRSAILQQFQFKN